MAELPALQHDVEVLPLGYRLELEIPYLFPRLHAQQGHEERRAHRPGVDGLGVEDLRVCVCCVAVGFCFCETTVSACFHSR